MAAVWPLVGRDEELELILRAFRRGDSSGVVVAGEPGVGKTRLVSEALDQLRVDGLTTEWARATGATRSIALGALTPILGSLETAASPEDLLHRGLDSLTARSDPSSLVLAVDDAHLLDETSIALLHLLATQSAVRVLLTMRSGEPVPGTLVDLWKDEVIVRFDLEPLERRQTDDLVVSVLGDRVPTSVLERVWDLSQGNALFVRELITVAVQRRQAGGSGPVLMSGPSHRRLAELVDQRLRLLDEPSRSGFELVAVGEQVPLPLAEQLVAGDVLEDLERRHLIVVRGEGAGALLEVAHPLYGEVVRESLPAVRRRGLLRSLVEAVGGARGIDALRMAAWQLDIGQADDVDRLVAMSREAAARFDYTLAERLAHEANGHGHHEGALVLAEALAGQGRAAEAESWYAAFVPGTTTERARWAVARARNLFWGLSRVDPALEAISTAEDALADDVAAQVECRSLRAHFLLYTARVEEALDLAESVLDNPAASDAARVRALASTFVLWPARGHGDRILDYGDEWFDIGRRVRAEVPFGELQLRMTRALALVWTGRFREAERFALADLGLGVRHAPLALRGILDGLKGGSAYSRGHMWEALGRLNSSYRAFSEGDWFGQRPWAAAFRVRAAVFAGDLAAAREALEDAELAYEADPVRSAFALPDLELSRAWLDAAEGMRSHAADRCRVLGTALAGLVIPLAAEAFHSLARLGRANEAADPLHDLANSCDSRAVGAYAGHARALADRDAAGLDAAAVEFESLGVDLLAAEAFRSAANLYATAGLGRSAQAAARRCDELLQACGRPVSPALEPEVIFGEQLTEREREVATLAAQMFSSQQIAERLRLSIRTVDTHLSRSYRKLMIVGRHELGDALGIEPTARR